MGKRAGGVRLSFIPPLMPTLVEKAPEGKASHDGQAGTSRCQSMGSAFWVEPLGIFTVLSEWPSSSLERCLLSLALCTWPARF
jgi:hypothetical protein